MQSNNFVQKVWVQSKTFLCWVLFKHVGCKALFFLNIKDWKEEFCSSVLGAVRDFCSNILGVKQNFCSNMFGARQDFYSNGCEARLCSNVVVQSITFVRKFWV